MAATWTQAWTQVQDDVKLIEDQRLSLVSGGATGFLTQAAVVVAGKILEPSNDKIATDGMSALQKAVESFLTSGRPLLQSALNEALLVAKVNEKDVATQFRRLRRYMVDNPDSISPAPRVKSRQILRGSYSAGTPYGTGAGGGTVLRLAVDEDGFAIENSFCEKLTFECVQDRQSGTLAGQELFEIRGYPRPDRVHYYQTGYGSGVVARQAAVSADSSVGLVQNPSFSDYAGTTSAPTAVTGWEFETSSGSGVWSSTPVNVTIDQTNYYRKAQCESTAAALSISATQSLRQKISAQRGAIDPSDAIFSQIAYNRTFGSGNATGTLNLKIGSKTYTVSVSAGSSWAILRCDLDKYCYLRNFNQDDLRIQIDWTRSSGAGTTITIDDLIVCKWKKVDNVPTVIVGDSTHFLKGANGSITDTEAGSKLQRAFHALFGEYLPAVPSKPSSACSAADSGVAGNPNGAYGYKVTYVDTQGQESAGNTTAATVTVSSKKVDLSSIPVGGTNIVSRKIYRTVASGSTYKLLTTIADNVTTTYQDNTADGSLGATIPDGVTIDDPS